MINTFLTDRSFVKRIVLARYSFLIRHVTHHIMFIHVLANVVVLFRSVLPVSLNGGFPMPAWLVSTPIPITTPFHTTHHNTPPFPPWYPMVIGCSSQDLRKKYHARENV